MTEEPHRLALLKTGSGGSKDIVLFGERQKSGGRVGRETVLGAWEE